MGLFWDLVQHSQISSQKRRADSLDDRIEDLERELVATQELLVEVVRQLEVRLGEDLDGDDRVG